MDECLNLQRLCLSIPRKAIHGPEITQQPMGQEESDLAWDKEEEEEGLASYPNQQGALSPLSGEGAQFFFFLHPFCLTGY